MKDYKKLLADMSPKDYILIEHEWGHNPQGVYNQIVDAWNTLALGQKVCVLSRKKFGLKSLVAFLKEKGLIVDMVGKGSEDVRMFEIIKDSDIVLKREEPHNTIAFEFCEKKYQVNVGNAVFSKTGLDDGTRFLLETACAAVQDFSNKTVADLGAGWGAISLIIASEFPASKVIACEKEVAELEALRENVKDLKNIYVLKTDLFQKDSKRDEYNRSLDFILSNFSFHITEEEREAFFKNVHKLLKPRGELFFVTEGRFVPWFEQNAQEYFQIIQIREYKGYKVFQCKK
jgi:16S rRNA G1207 methylase RsmC